MNLVLPFLELFFEGVSGFLDRLFSWSLYCFVLLSSQAVLQHFKCHRPYDDHAWGFPHDTPNSLPLKLAAVPASQSTETHRSICCCHVGGRRFMGPFRAITSYWLCEARFRQISYAFFQKQTTRESSLDLPTSHVRCKEP